MVTIHSENHVFSLDGRPFRSQGVTRSGIEIEENCWFGAKATILDGARIGRDCVIAAGAVLTAGDYEEGWVYAGVPARKLRPISKTTANERDLDNDNESAVCK
jgi:acetyltransferase-like isoleucine patch superfamily enzyme